MSNDSGVKAYRAFLEKYYPSADTTSTGNAQGYVMAQTMVQVLKQAGHDLTRQNIMRQAVYFRGLKIDMLLPGIKVSTSPPLP